MSQGQPAPKGRPRRPRKETFLARIPRWKKLAVTGGLLFLIFAPFFLPSFSGSTAEKAPHGVEKKDSHARLSQEGAANAPADPQAAEDLHAGAEAVETPEAPHAGNDLPPQPAKTYSSPEAAAIAENDATERAPLSHAPDPALTEKSGDGEIPRVSQEGRRAWQAYARPFNLVDSRPRIALVITGLGLSRVQTDAALQRLPPSVTFAFDVQGQSVQAWLERARNDGHETLVDIPMEPFDYPQNDPGPNALLTSLPNQENTERFLWALQQGAGYIGVTTDSGSRFTANTEKMRAIVGEAARRGLLLFDARITPHSVLKDLAAERHLPVVSVSRRIDDDPTAQAIDAALRELEQSARLQGRAVGTATALPITLDKLQAWAASLPARGFVLAPLSAMVGN